jgi:glycosyltransferase involved in cell wall biosynthesis
MKAVEFWSSVEYGTFQRGLVRALGASGWEAEHRFGVKQADYWDARSRAARLILRMRTYIVYPFQVFRRFLGGRPGSVGVVSTNTFFAPWIAAVASGRNGPPVVHWVFDLFPDVLIVAGAMNRGSAPERISRRVVRSAFDRSVANVFLGSRLLAFAERQFGPIPRAVVIPVGCDAEPFRAMPPAARVEGAPVRILYSGNLGRMHDVETIVDALEIGLPDGIVLDFCGNGPGFRRLQAAVQPLGLGARVRFAANLAEREWVQAMSAADIGLVTLRTGAEGVVMPSKTYSAMAAGQAVIAVCPPESDLEDTLRDHGCGWTVRPGDAAGLAAAWESAASDPGELLRRRRRAWNAGQEVFDQRMLAARWNSVLEAALHGKA